MVPGSTRRNREEQLTRDEFRRLFRNSVPRTGGRGRDDSCFELLVIPELERKKFNKKKSLTEYIKLAVV